MTDMTLPAGDFAHAKLMGAKLHSYDPSTQTITMHFHAPEAFITPRKSVQGGLVAGFLDEAMGWAYTYSTGGEFSPLMLDVNFSLLKPVLQGPLIATGRVVRAGRRVLFLESELWSEDGVLLARGTSTAIPTKNPASD